MRLLRWTFGLLLVGLLAVPVVAQNPPTPVGSSITTIYQGTTPVAIRHRLIDAAASGAQVIVEESAGKRICVLAAHLTMTGTAVTLRFESSGGGETYLTGQMTPTQGQTIPLPFNPVCWFKGNTGRALALVLGDAQSVDGSITYAYIDP